MTNQFYVKHWPVQNPTAVIALVHGAAEYVGRYEKLARDLRGFNFAVVATDLQGHGQSSGDRGHIHRFSDYLASVNHTFATIDSLYPNVPVILLGHSMGGLIAIRILQTQPLPKTLIASVLSSPCLGLSMKISTVMKGISACLDIFMPKLRVPNGIEASLLTRTAEVVHRQETDSNIVKTVTIHWYQELRRGMSEAAKGTHEFSVPMLVLQAGSDKIVSSEVTKLFYNQISAPKKDFILYPNCYHELFHEPEREQIIQDMLTWLQPILNEDVTTVGKE